MLAAMIFLTLATMNEALIDSPFPRISRESQ